jgi:hypothetical protein
VPGPLRHQPTGTEGAAGYPIHREDISLPGAIT